MTPDPREGTTAGGGDEVAILAGGGAFPLAVAAAVEARGGRAFLIGIRGEADPAIATFPHTWIALGQIGHLFAAARKRKLSRLVMIGSIVSRRLPRPWELDLVGLMHLWKNRDIMKSGDDTTLRRVAKLIEAGGFEVVAAADVAPNLVMPAGPIGKFAPEGSDWRDIAAGFAAAKELGARDLGQGVIAVDGTVARREDRRGTDAMLADHAGAHGRGPRGGVLVKCLKPQQDRRLDMPALGTRTVDGAARAGLRGIAVEAGGTLVLNLEEVARAADLAGLYVVGVNAASLMAETPT